MKKQVRARSNLAEVKRIKPVKNKAVYTAIVPRDLTSVSHFSRGSIVIPELNSTSRPRNLKEYNKREA